MPARVPPLAGHLRERPPTHVLDDLVVGRERARPGRRRGPAREPDPATAPCPIWGLPTRRSAVLPLGSRSRARTRMTVRSVCTMRPITPTAKIELKAPRGSKATEAACTVSCPKARSVPTTAAAEHRYGALVRASMFRSTPDFGVGPLRDEREFAAGAQIPGITGRGPARPGDAGGDARQGEEPDGGEHDRAARREPPLAGRREPDDHRHDADGRRRRRGRARTSARAAGWSPPGSTISAATSSTPTTRIAATIVTAVSTASSVLSASTGRPATRADSSSTTIANSARPANASVATMTHAEHDDRRARRPRDREDRTEQVRQHVDAASRRRAAREHDRRRDAAVEAQREREVARRAPVRAQPLDQRPRRRRPRSSAVQIGHTSRSSPAATPANATWPMPSPMSDMRFCTRNTPISGAHAPTTSPASERELHVLAVERPGHQHEPFEPQREVLGVDAEAHAGAARSAGRPSNSTVRLSTITRSRSSATAPSSCETSSTRAVLGDEMDERVAEQPLRLGVDAGDRLVEHEQLGIADERLGDEHALLLAARELAHAPAPQVGERDGAQRVVDGVAVARRRASATSPVGRAARPRTTSSTVAGRSRRQLRAAAARSRCGSGRSRRRGSSPSTRTAPALGRSRPSRMRSSVDLPLPFGPTSAANSPLSTRNVTSSSTGVAPYANERCSTSMTGARSGSRDANHNESDSQVSASSRRRRR